MCGAQGACEPKPRPAPPPLDRAAALFLDVDGTLLEIAARPDLVRVSPRLPILLGRLAASRGGALALVSGRPLIDLDRLFPAWRGAAAGLHGLVRRRADGSLAASGDAAASAALAALRAPLTDFARARPGLLLEDKGGTIALHYRKRPQDETEIRALAESLCRATGPALRLIAGKKVVEFQPQSANKAGAIAAFLAEPPFCRRCPVFLGDDTTDEDGFAEVNRRGGLSIRVGGPAATAACYGLASVAAARRWLLGGASG
ncbi:MAG TPA: trehalose-phosphatase [Stellaceae bacterium]|nr:trehalose-phosphatase [Stellaceae bacterium]